MKKLILLKRWDKRIKNNFRIISSSQKHNFLSQIIILRTRNWNIDVDDDDENIIAHGNGLMIIRKLFGFTFGGEALTY